jgi:hypothetical protein
VPNLGPNNPLMQMLYWDGQEYLTSMRLHEDDVRNATEQGETIKYERHDHYLRVIRSIPNYNILIDQKDIIVLEWKSIKSSNDVRTQKLGFALKAYFVANSYKRITFLNRTAQMELTHHLEDQLNQEIAYRHSRQGRLGTL